MCIIFIKLVSQMEHYLTIWFNTGNLYLLNFSFARKSFYRKTIPLIKNFTFARIFKTMQINNSVFRINIGFTFVFPDVIIYLRNRLRYQMII